ncbi:inorganic pyrophosphatase [Paragonimus westermani]|uniref:Inorganic pyrophosphatase n=1 Tax=Paragonimus westermani TaxID=34504 RepID=A0A5J4NYP1_9TREM|nr:inorganic pyrophosphatase [Paragonimus westermani]
MGFVGHANSWRMRLICFRRGSPLVWKCLSMMSTFSVSEHGAAHSTDYRMFIKSPSGPVSPFHDIPLYSDKQKNIFNMLVEIPRWTNAKMEICKEEYMNPIKQDVKKGQLRYVNNVFPHKGYMWNYGALPQTWEDPSHVDPDTQAKGDNDPIDACEIGSKILQRGEVVQVKVLGILAMIDEGETDWKVITISVHDPMASKLNDITDVEKHMPGFLKATRNWFKYYKVPTGKPENQFAFNGDFKDKAFALATIEQTHKQWQLLISGKADSNGIVCSNVNVKESPFLVPTEDFKAELLRCVPLTVGDQPNDPAIEQWHFCNPDV